MRTSAEERAVLARLDERAGALVERAVRWCDIGSGSRNLDGLQRQLQALEETAAGLPCRVETLALPASEEVADDGRRLAQPHTPALRLTCRPDAPIQVVLTGHYDTVYPAGSAFDTVRQRPDGALNGPGIADMKGGLSVMLAALEAFETYPDRHGVGWTVLLSPDEEIGSPASAPLLAELGARGHLGLTYEPAMAEGVLASSRKGSANFALTVRGRAAHAGRAFAEGRNAVAGAAMLASALHDLNGRHEGVTVNIGRIGGGGPTNVVPEVAVVRFNIRVPDAEAAAWAEAQVRTLADAPPFEGLTLELSGGFTRPPKPLDAAQAALVEAVTAAGADLGQDIRWAASGGVCEGNNLHAAGLPNIDTLGVMGGDIHSDREYAWPDSFAPRAQLSALILMRVAQGRIDAARLKALRCGDMAAC